MKNLKLKFERFCLRNRSKGIPNLMLYIGIGTLIVFVFSMIDPSNLLYNLFCFDRTSILHGQVWRLVTFLIVPATGTGIWNSFLNLVMLFFFYQIGRILESQMGVCKFGIFYFTGVVILDVVALVFGGSVSAIDLNLSLILAFATLFPENQVLLFFIIPLKMKYLAWFYLAFTAYEVLAFRTLFPLVALLNYFLFFYEEMPGILPFLRRPRRSASASKRPRPDANWAGQYRSKSGERPYHHKCTVCGRTDTEYPNLEFRYCSKCRGYYCYCEDHINNHAHIQ